MRHPFVALLPTLAVALAACSDVQPPVAPGTTSSARAVQPGTPSADNTNGKVSICHRTQGGIPFVLISIAPTAVDAHLAHGDGTIGDPYPGQPGMRFGSDCLAEAIPIHVTLLPAANGFVRDGSNFVGRDGTPDVIQPGNPTLVNNTDIDARGIIEFDISTLSQPVGHAELRLPIVYVSSDLPFPRRVDVYPYQGNGSLDLSDFGAGSPPFTPFASFVLAGETQDNIDVTTVVNSFIAAHASYVGFNLRLWIQGPSALTPPTVAFGSTQNPPSATLDVHTP